MTLKSSGTKVIKVEMQRSKRTKKIKSSGIKVIKVEMQRSKRTKKIKTSVPFSMNNPIMHDENFELMANDDIILVYK